MLVSESSQSRLLLVSSALDVEKYRIDHILFVSVEVTGDECPLLQLPLRRGEARQVQDQRHQSEVGCGGQQLVLSNSPSQCEDRLSGPLCPPVRTVQSQHEGEVLGREVERGGQVNRLQYQRD